MKYRLLASAILASALAACSGGGGSSPLPQPVPTPTTKPATYSVTLKYTGGAEPRSGLSYVRRSESVSAMAATATPPPVLLVAPDNSSGLAQFQPGTGDSEAIATAQVAPSPSSSPSATWSGGDSNVSVVPQQATSAAVNATTNNHHDNTSVTSNVNVPGSAPVTLTPQVFVYDRLTLSCQPNDESSAPNANEWVSGAAFDASGNVTATSSPSTSDIYVDGPNCYGAFKNTSESVETLHMPYGGHVSADGTKALNQFIASDYAGETTSISFESMFPSSGPVLDNVTFKDVLGQVHFWFITHAELPYGKNSGGVKTCNGHSIDASC